MYKFEILFPFKTPTINHLYWHRGNIKIMKTEAKKLRKEIKELINKWPIDKEKLFDKHLRVRVEVHEDWITKKGEVKRKDVANREKFLIDSVFDAIGIDDKFIFEHNIVKCQNSTNEYVVVKIETL